MVAEHATISWPVRRYKLSKITGRQDMCNFKLSISNHWARNQGPGPLSQSYTFLQLYTMELLSNHNQAHETKKSHPQRLQILTML